ncbi:hypothetical protein [Oenococcus oeni]
MFDSYFADKGNTNKDKYLKVSFATFNKNALKKLPFWQFFYF